MALVRSLLHFIGTTIVLIVVVSLAMLLFFMPLKQRYQLLSQWCYFNIWWLKLCVGLTHRIIGAENIPKDACVVVSNHQSTWETIAFLTLFPQQVWVLKKQLLRIPVFGWGLAMLAPIVIDRSEKLKALRKANEQGRQRLKDGLWVIIFPEGTRKPYTQLGAYQSGAAAIAKAADALLLPVYHNAGKFWAKGQFIKKSGCIDVVIGKPIDTKGRKSSELIKEIEAWTKQQAEQFNKSL